MLFHLSFTILVCYRLITHTWELRWFLNSNAKHHTTKQKNHFYTKQASLTTTLSSLIDVLAIFLDVSLRLLNCFLLYNSQKSIKALI